ncbi:AAA family ATPase [Streptomyces sp. TG1A-8]|uniref:AAA family ATPase n=1 Tax=Streptomyces sp. TG1A-8 TaxID=3051385 RepID=UPI00265B764D|nr:AAA family ATPase [Streptomyces sp. TG1A-8]MDO0927824.1 AAA family ATPase [Streptomyces sp. TG1A-8]
MSAALKADERAAQELCRRWVRKPPTVTGHAVALRAELRALLTALPGRSPLRGGAVPNTDWRPSAASDLPRDPETNQTLLRLGEPPTSSGPVLDETCRAQVDRIVAERPLRERLIEVGLQPSRSLLLSGPPGVGKSMTAAYIAEQMKQPLLIVDLAAVMSSYLGRTGRNLRAVLDYASQTECVLFIDEFDALAKRRDDNTDVGELKRLVNVLLLELDRWPAGSFLVAATNHLELVDAAIARRFDVKVEMPMPECEQRKNLLAQIPVVVAAGVGADCISLLALATEGKSHSDIVKFVSGLAREVIIQDGNLEKFSERIVEYAMVTLREQSKSDSETRSQIIRLAYQSLGYSQRKIASILGVSHPTVSRALASQEK